MSSDKLIYLISAEATERDSLSRYFRKHNFNIEVFSGLADGKEAVESRLPELIVLAGSSIPSPDICKFGAFVEQKTSAPADCIVNEIADVNCFRNGGVGKSLDGRIPDCSTGSSCFNCRSVSGIGSGLSG